MNENNNNTNNVMEKAVRVTRKDIKYKVYVHMDFGGVSHEQLVKWAFQSQIIAMQRVLRDCSAETLAEFEAEGYEVHALAAGQKPQTASEVKAQAKRAISQMDEAAREALIEELMNG